MDINSVIKNLEPSKLKSVLKSFGMNLSDAEVVSLKNKISAMSNSDINSKINQLKNGSRSEKEKILSQLADNPELLEKMKSMLK